MSGTVLVVGSLNMDLVVNAKRLPKSGETVLGGKFSTFPGGKGANQAVAAKRMGGHVALLGRVGEDAFGEQLLAYVSKEGIDARWVTRAKHEPTGIALITVDASGLNTIVVASGANLTLTRQDLDAYRDAFIGSAVLVTQFESPMESVSEAITLAASRGMRIVVNPAPALRISEGLLSKIDYLIPNEQEAIQIAGTASVDDAAEKLIRMGLKHLIITLGEKGVLVAGSHGSKRIPAHRVKAVDTVGAGDAFVGAFAAAIAEDLSLDDAVRLGNAAAAISVTRLGAQPSLPTRQEVEQFLIRSV